MKTALFISILFCCPLVRAENIRSKDGTVYQNVTIVSADSSRMLIVHDGGGCQVEFKDLAPNSLTVAQRQTVEEEIKLHVERKARIERIQLEREAFEIAQREKGLIEFEGAWISPLEKDELLTQREERKLELERQRIQLAREKAELEKERLQTERARYLLEGEKKSSGLTVSYGYYRTYPGDCIGTLPVKPDCSLKIIRSGQSNPYICTDNAPLFNRGPFNRY